MAQETQDRAFNDGGEKEWEIITHDEGQPPSVENSVSCEYAGHFDFKIGTKRWNHRLLSVDWSKPPVCSNNRRSENAREDGK